MSCISLIHSSQIAQKFILLITEQKNSKKRKETKERIQVKHVHKTLTHQRTIIPQIYIIIISKAKQKTQINFP